MVIIACEVVYAVSELFQGVLSNLDVNMHASITIFIQTFFILDQTPSFVFFVPNYMEKVMESDWTDCNLYKIGL